MAIGIVNNMNMLGFAGGGFCPEYKVIYDAMSVKPTSAQAKSQNLLIQEQKTIFSESLYWYWYSLHNETEALKNCKNLAETAVKHGGVTHQANKGFFADGVDGYIDTKFNPSAVTAFPLNNCSSLHWSNTRVRTTSRPYWIIKGQELFGVLVRNAADAFAFAINTRTQQVAAGTVLDQWGLTAIVRDSANHSFAQMNNVLIQESTNASYAKPNSVVYDFAYKVDDTISTYNRQSLGISIKCKRALTSAEIISFAASYTKYFETVNPEINLFGRYSDYWDYETRIKTCVKDIILFGNTAGKTYEIGTIGNSPGSTARIYVSEIGGGQVCGKLADVGTSADYFINSDCSIIELPTLNSSGITALVTVNWAAAKDTSWIYSELNRCFLGDPVLQGTMDGWKYKNIASIAKGATVQTHEVIVNEVADLYSHDSGMTIVTDSDGTKKIIITYQHNTTSASEGNVNQKVGLVVLDYNTHTVLYRTDFASANLVNNGITVGNYAIYVPRALNFGIADTVRLFFSCRDTSYYRDFNYKTNTVGLLNKFQFIISGGVSAVDATQTNLSAHLTALYGANTDFDTLCPVVRGDDEVRVKDGVWYIAIDGVGHIAGGTKGISGIMSSNDSGVTWTLGGFVYTATRSYYEPTTQIVGDNIYMFLRSSDTVLTLMYSISTDDGATWSIPVKMAIGSRSSRISSDKSGSNHYFAFTGSVNESPWHTVNRDILKIMSSTDCKNWTEFITILKQTYAHYPVIKWDSTRLNMVYTSGTDVSQWANQIVYTYYDNI